ncbi:hypothetical protein SIL87_02780 [Acidiphilium acidophilum]|uniref:Uncharacterized protein n=1 Tax=Acidiphilium acidophilum TaxID=76588 RepID=A0AAW9DMX3_ACIAO|nr:hypothetical protein [Acidiphilium acidophilum]
MDAASSGTSTASQYRFNEIAEPIAKGIGNAKAQTYRDTDGMKYWDAIVRIAQIYRTDLPDPLRPHRLN